MLYLKEEISNSSDIYIIDLKWFDKIHCRQPLYQCINFIEYYILNDEDEVIDSIKITSRPFVNTFYNTLYKVDKETYDKIKFYMRG